MSLQNQLILVHIIILGRQFGVDEVLIDIQRELLLHEDSNHHQRVMVGEGIKRKLIFVVSQMLAHQHEEKKKYGILKLRKDRHGNPMGGVVICQPRLVPQITQVIGLKLSDKEWNDC